MLLIVVYSLKKALLRLLVCIASGKTSGYAQSTEIVKTMNIQKLLRVCFLYIIATMPLAAHAASATGGLGSGRLLPGLAALAGLGGIIIGWRARNGRSQTRALVAGILGLSGLLIGVLHAANAAGGFGTGNGLAGAIVAMLLGLASTVIGLIGLVRSRHIAK